jgi:hypothetical protein
VAPTKARPARTPADARLTQRMPAVTGVSPFAYGFSHRLDLSSQNSNKHFMLFPNLLFLIYRSCFQSLIFLLGRARAQSHFSADALLGYPSSSCFAGFCCSVRCGDAEHDPGFSALTSSASAGCPADARARSHSRMARSARASALQQLRGLQSR